MHRCAIDKNKRYWNPNYGCLFNPQPIEQIDLRLTCPQVKIYIPKNNQWELDFRSIEKRISYTILLDHQENYFGIKVFLDIKKVQNTTFLGIIEFKKSVGHFDYRFSFWYIEGNKKGVYV